MGTRTLVFASYHMFFMTENIMKLESNVEIMKPDVCLHWIIRPLRRFRSVGNRACSASMTGRAAASEGYQ